MERDLGIWVDGELNTRQQCALAAKRSDQPCLCPGVHQTQHSLMREVEGGACPTSHCTDAVSPQALLCSFGCLNIRRT